MIVSDLFPGIIAKLGNRSDLEPKMPEWVRKTVLELTQSYDFEELKVSAPFTNFIINQAEYLTTYFTVDNEQFSRLTGWFIQLSESSPIGWEIKGRSLMTVDPLSKINGIPMYWAQHGNLLIVGFNPDQAYNTQMRYQRYHPFPVTNPAGSQAGIAGAPIYMPVEWQEIIEYAAALRGASEERMFDYVQQYHDMIYGDVKFRLTNGKEGFPGLIFGLTSKQDRNMTLNERQLVPNMQKYGRS